MSKEFILHLTLIEDIGPAVIQKIQHYVERSGVQTSDLYLFSQSDWQNNVGLTDLTAERLVAGLAHTKMFDEEIALLEKHAIAYVTVDEPHYPSLLKEIYLPPALLYYQSLHNLSENSTCKSIAVVGARKANVYGQRFVSAVIPDLVNAGYTIVSGGALGIDTMAHSATLASGGKTIAVLGSGLLCAYPSSNKKLFASIVEHGGSIISSFPLRMQALQGHFPARNRIVTGLSHGCLVVQAAQKSGALISAHYAMEQGREVFAVPGAFDDELSVGCNTLIQQGAKLVMSSADILSEFGDRIILPDKQIMKNTMQQLSLDTLVSRYSDVQKKIIAACKQSISFDDILVSTQLPPQDLQSELFNLQLDGVLSQDFVGMWKII